MAKPLVGYLLVVAAALLVLGGRAYHVVFAPTWTEAQVLRNLWPAWALASVLGATGLALADWKK